MLMILSVLEKLPSWVVSPPAYLCIGWSSSSRSSALLTENSRKSGEDRVKAEISGRRRGEPGARNLDAGRTMRAVNIFRYFDDTVGFEEGQLRSDNPGTPGYSGLYAETATTS